MYSGYPRDGPDDGAEGVGKGAPLPLETTMLSPTRATVRTRPFAKGFDPSAAVATSQVAVRVPPEDLAYRIDPVHVGGDVVFVNSGDPSFYQREPKGAITSVWCLVDDEVAMTSYAAKRMFESCFQAKVSFKAVLAKKFLLLSSKSCADGQVVYDDHPQPAPQCVLLWLTRMDDYTLSVVQHLKNQGSKMLNPSEAVLKATSNLRVLQELSGTGLPLCRFVVAQPPFNMAWVETDLDFPITAEQCDKKDVFMYVSNKDQLDAMSTLLQSAASPLLFQETADGKERREVRSLVVGGRVVTSAIKLGGKGFRHEATTATNAKPIKLRQGSEWLILEAARTVGLDVATVDLVLEQETLKIVGLTPAPDFELLEAVTGVNVGAALVEYLTIRMGLWRKKVGPRAAASARSAPAGTQAALPDAPAGHHPMAGAGAGHGAGGGPAPPGYRSATEDSNPRPMRGAGSDDVEDTGSFRLMPPGTGTTTFQPPADNASRATESKRDASSGPKDGYGDEEELPMFSPTYEADKRRAAAKATADQARAIASAEALTRAQIDAKRVADAMAGKHHARRQVSKDKRRVQATMQELMREERELATPPRATRTARNAAGRRVGDDKPMASHTSPKRGARRRPAAPVAIRDDASVASGIHMVGDFHELRIEQQ